MRSLPFSDPRHPIYLDVDLFKTRQLVIPAHDKVLDGESAACRSPVLLNSHDTRPGCFMPLGRGTSLTLLRVCPSALQLAEQARKSCLQGASAQGKLPSTKEKTTFLSAPVYFHSHCTRSWARFLPGSHHRTVMCAEYFGSELQYIKHFSETT